MELKQRLAGIPLILLAIYWFVWEFFKDILFGWLGTKFMDALSEADMTGFAEFLIQYLPPAILLLFGVWLLFSKNKKPIPDMSLRDAYKYLMLDSKWSIGRKASPYESGSGAGKIFVDMNDELKKAAYSGKLKVWSNHDTELDARRWENDYKLDVVNCMGGYGDTSEIYDYSDYQSTHKTKRLVNIMVNKNQVLFLCPKASKKEKQNDKDLYELRKAFYQKEYKH